MGMTTFIGKALIIASLMFQAYLLFADRQAITSFDKQLTRALTACSCLTPEISKYVREYLRVVVGGLVASSALILAFRCWFFKLPTLLGLILLLWVEHHEVFAKIPTISILENTALWHSLGVIGVIIYLLGVQCLSCEKSCSKVKVQESKKQDKKKK